MREMRDCTLLVDGEAPVLHAFRLAAVGQWLGELDGADTDEHEALLVRPRDRLSVSARAELAASVGFEWRHCLCCCAHRQTRTRTRSDVGDDSCGECTPLLRCRELA